MQKIIKNTGRHRSINQVIDGQNFTIRPLEGLAPRRVVKTGLLMSLTPDNSFSIETIRDMNKWLSDRFSRILSIKIKNTLYVAMSDFELLVEGKEEIFLQCAIIQYNSLTELKSSRFWKIHNLSKVN